MKQTPLHVITLYFVLFFASFAGARTLDELYRRQGTDACAPACADRNAMQEACAAERDADCCRPTYGSAHLTCAYCLSFQPGITDEQRERLHQSAQAYVEGMSAACERKGQPLQPASVTLTITPTATSAATGTGSKTAQPGASSTSGSNSSNGSTNSNSNSGARTTYLGGQMSWDLLVPVVCALGMLTWSAR